MPHDVETVLTVLFAPILGLCMTLAIVFASMGKFRDKRFENIQQASTTWHELYDAEKADGAKKDMEIGRLERELNRERRRTDYLWQQLTPTQRQEEDARLRPWVNEE